MGTLMAKPMNRPPKMSSCVLCVIVSAFAARNSIEKLSPPVLKNRARKLSSIKADPNNVNRKNLIAAYCRCSPPQTPIMKYIGSSTTSKKTKNKMRSWATNVPFIPISSTRIRMKKAFRLPGSGMWSHE